MAILSINVGMAGGRSMGKQWGERYRRKERKDVEVGVLKRVGRGRNRGKLHTNA